MLSAHINRTASPDMFRVLGEVGLSFTQMKALFLLSSSTSELSVKHIAGHLAMSLPAMSRSVDGLVQRGYVARRECASDRRSRLVALLPAGRDVLGRVIAARGAALVGVRRRALRGGAQRAARRTPPHRRKDPLPMTERLRLSEHNRRWWTLGAMSFALFMVMLDNTAVNVALPSIQADFGASLSALEWTVNAYTLTFAVLLVTGGRLGDIFGRRRMFLFGVVVFSLASATIGFAPTEGWLVASRAVQGVGAAFMMPGTLSIITNAFPPEERGKAIGTWAGVSAIALALGPLLGGWLTEEVSWRAIFFLNLPVAVGAIVVTLFAAHESRDETVGRTVDIPGIAGITVGLTALVFALVEGNAWGWGSPAILGLLVLSVVAFAAFVAIEKRATRAGRGLRGAALQAVPRRERRRLHGLVRDARDVLLPRALHAEHPRLQPAPGGRPLPALDRRDHLRRPDRGAARRSLRPAPADGRGDADHRPPRCSGSRSSRSTPATRSSRPRSC